MAKRKNPGKQQPEEKNELNIESIYEYLIHEFDSLPPEKRRYPLTVNFSDGDKKISGHLTKDLHTRVDTLQQIIEEHFAGGRPALQYIASDIYAPKRNTENFGLQYLLYVDVDSGPSLLEFMRRTRGFLLALYTSKNHRKAKEIKHSKDPGKHRTLPPADRFRAIFRLPFPVRKVAVANLLHRMLTRALGGDPEFNSVITGVYGAKGAQFRCYPDARCLDVNWLIRYTKQGDSGEFETLIASICRNAGCSAEELNQWLCADASNAGYVLTERLPVIQTLAAYPKRKRSEKHTSDPADQEAMFEAPYYPRVNLDGVKMGCYLLRNIGLAQHGERMHALYNLNCAEGGVKFLSKLFEDSGLSDKWEQEYRGHTRYVRQKGYFPSRCDKAICRFAGTEHCPTPPVNMLALDRKRGQVRKIIETDNPTLTFEQAQSSFAGIISQVLASKDTDVHIIKVPSEIGNKEALASYLERFEGRAIIACPSQRALDEIPSIPCYPPAPEWYHERQKVFHPFGLHVRKELDYGAISEEQQAELKEFDMMGDLALQQPVLGVTHRRMLVDSRCRQDRDLYVFNGEPMGLNPSLPGNKKLLSYFLESNSDDPTISTVIGLLETILEAHPGETIHNNAKPSSTELKRLEIAVRKTYDPSARKKGRQNGAIDLVNLACSDYIHMQQETVSWITKQPLPEGGKIVIISSTIDDQFWMDVYPELRFHMHEIGPVAVRANLIQYLDVSFSRSTLINNPVRKENYGDLIDVLKALRYNIVTYKEFQGDNHGIYFGASQDQYLPANESVAVVGTFGPPENYLVLRAALAGYDYKSIARYSEVQKSGNQGIREVSYSLHGETIVFDEEVPCEDNRVWRLQVHFKVSALEAAVERARPLQNEIDILVFSNIPLSRFHLSRARIAEVIEALRASYPSNE